MRLVSTRHPKVRSSFTEALAGGFAPDGGLWVPEPVACFRDIPHLLGMAPLERATEILHRLLGDEWSREDTDALVREAFDLPCPLVSLRDRLFVLELFHGPGLGFADLGVRFLARALALRRATEGLKLRTVLVATCGSTGAAVAEAFRGMRGFRVVILYPKGRLSPQREAQFATLGGSVLAYAVEGSYEDCQRLVHGALADRSLVESLGLVSADALNVARLLAQVLIFFEGAARLRELGLREPPVIAIPCGSFGLLCAGLWAKAMGLPVKAFVVARAGDPSLEEPLGADGRLRGRASQSLAAGLEVSDPPQWERILHLHAGDLAGLRSTLRWGAVDEKIQRRALWELHGLGYFAEPHTATAYGALESHRGLAEVGLVLATAHPATWADGWRCDMNVELPLPPALLEAQARPCVSRPLEPREEALLEVLKG